MIKVLIVEDDAVLAKMYQRKFELNGFETQVAPDGEEGLTKMRSFSPDLVLMDVMMPKLDGFAALERAKADPALKNIPVVILTNLSTMQDAESAIKKGAIAHIVKSDLTPAQVVEQAKDILAKTSGSPAASAAGASSPTQPSQAVAPAPTQSQSTPSQPTASTTPAAAPGASSSSDGQQQ